MLCSSSAALAQAVLIAKRMSHRGLLLLLLFYLGYLLFIFPVYSMSSVMRRSLAGCTKSLTAFNLVNTANSF